MPKITEDPPLPEGLRVYKFHGLAGLEPSLTEDDAKADCPFCGKEGKFGINQKSSLFNCFVCGTKGNEHTFVRQLWEMAYKLLKPTSPAYAKLVADSGFSSSVAVHAWGVAKHPLTDEYCLPGWNHEGKITGLYRWCPIRTEDGKWTKRLLPSPGMGHHLFGLSLYDDAKPIVALCEGWRSAIRLYEVLRDTERGGVPLLDDINVIAVPGANSFKREWCRWFEGKVVWILYDNDHPNVNPKTGKEVLVGGPAGVARVASILQSAEAPPDEIHYLGWGVEPPARYNPDLPSKYDVRDFLNA